MPLFAKVQKPGGGHMHTLTSNSSSKWSRSSSHRHWGVFTRKMWSSSAWNGIQQLLVTIKCTLQAKVGGALYILFKLVLYEVILGRQVPLIPIKPHIHNTTVQLLQLFLGRGWVGYTQGVHVRGVQGETASIPMVHSHSPFHQNELKSGWEFRLRERGLYSAMNLMVSVILVTVQQTSRK